MRRSPRARRRRPPGRPSTTDRAGRPGRAARRGSRRRRDGRRVRVARAPRRAGGPRSASAAIASPFQAASALSSRAGCGRAAAAPSSAPARAGQRAPRDVAASRRRRGRSGDRIVRALPVAVVGHAVGGARTPARRRRAPRGSRSARQVNVTPSSPSVSASWLAANAPSSRRQLAEHVVERRRSRPRGSARSPVDRPGVEVHARELGVVVEHLLEVRHQPVGVGRVAMEAAAELVVDPAVGHRVERPPRDRERPRVAGRDRAPQQVLDRHRLRELRRAAPAAVARVELRARARRVAASSSARVGAAPRPRAAAGSARRAPRPAAGPTPRSRRARSRHASVDALEHLAERRHAVARLVREVRAAVERPARPASGTRDIGQPPPPVIAWTAAM